MDQNCDDIRYESEEETGGTNGDSLDESTDEMLRDAAGGPTEGDVDFNPDEFDRTGSSETRSLQPYEDLTEMELVLGNIDVL